MSDAPKRVSVVRISSLVLGMMYVGGWLRLSARHLVRLVEPYVVMRLKFYYIDDFPIYGPVHLFVLLPVAADFQSDGYGAFFKVH